MNFDEMFAPTLTQLRLEQRPQQRHLGWAVVQAMADGTHLVGEARTGTGKSFAYLVPAIFAYKHREKRTIVSTETTALQDQLVKKDLPLLHNIYGGFKFRSLKGRRWYYCQSRARMNSRGAQRIADIVSDLGKYLAGGLGDGERLDCERRIGREISQDDWDSICGATEFCADNKCKPEVCFSSRAREKALDADIVVTNHAMLRTDADMRENDMSVLGDFDILVVDEAHTLEGVLVDGWTMTTSPWEIDQAEADIIEGMQRSQIVVAPNYALEEETARAFESFELALLNITKFFKMRAQAANGSRPVVWGRENFPLSEVYLSGVPDAKMLDAMTEYENVTPKRIRTMLDVLDRTHSYLKNAAEEAADQNVSGIRKIRKGVRAAREMKELLTLVEKALPTRDGIIMHFGVPYGVIVEGLTRRKGDDSVRLKVVPIDVSGRTARTVWPKHTCILLSATMTDPTDGTFTYTAASLGMVDYKTVQVDSPFTYATQQLVYVTPAASEVVDVAGARYSIDELVDVIHASNGRTLVLFTARAELDHAFEELTDRRKRGQFPYPIYFQDKSTPKQKLVDAFKEDEHSVLLATKSFFTGTDFPGSTCSTVAICKFPLPQYNTLCKQQMEWWKRRGWPAWYDRQALTVFAQAAGRLIRSETDHGVVAILDQRVADPKQNVHRTAMLGISHLGSPVTNSLEDVVNFLNTPRGVDVR